MTLTNSTTRAILTYLSLNGWYVWRSNTGAMTVTESNKKKRFVQFGKKGLPDICGFKTGYLINHENIYATTLVAIGSGAKFIGIEIKTGKDKLSIHQLEFAKELTAANGAYFCVRSFDDFKIQYEAWLRAPVTFNFQQLISLKANGGK